MNLPRPLFSGATSIALSEHDYYGAHPKLESYLAEFDSKLNVFEGMNSAREFISAHVSSQTTGENLSSFGSTRIVIERLLLWAWIMKEKPVEFIEKVEFREFLEFNSVPPVDWVGDVSRKRFFWVTEIGYVANPAWRPFSRPANDSGMRSKSMFELIVSYCASFYDLLIQKGVCQLNPARHYGKLPIQSLTVESRPIDRGLTAWHVDQILRVGATLDCGRHERALFIVAMMRYLLMPLRSIVQSQRTIPSLNIFKHTACGVQYIVNGLRGVQRVTAPDKFVLFLERYRASRGLTMQTPEYEEESLLVSLKGRPGLTQRQIRNIVHELVEATIQQLECEGFDHKDTIPLKVSCMDSIRVASISGSLQEDGVYKTQEKLGTEIFSSILRKGL